MKVVKLVSSIMTILFLSATIAFAQPDGDRDQMLQKRLDKMAEHLELNDAQKDQVQAIFEDGMQKMQALRNQEGDRASKRESMKAIVEAQNQEIEKVLTKEQLVKFNEMKAKRGEGRRGHRGKMEKRRNKKEHKALKADIKQYTQKNIMPILKEQRVKLDDVMSEADKNKVDELRASFKARKEAMKAAKKQHKGKKREDFSDEDKAKFKKYKEAMKADMEIVKALAKKYEDDMEALRQEIEPQSEQWKEDIDGIFEKHGVERPNRDELKKEGESAKEGRSKRRGRKAGKRNRRGAKGFPAMKAMSPVGFILLDPNGENEIDLNETPTTTSLNIKVYPNPAQDFNNIEYTIVEAGNISIELHDQDGNLIRTIVNQYQEAGTYTKRVNLGDLKGFVYMYVLKDEAGSILTEKFVLRK